MTNFSNDTGTGIVVADGFALADGSPVGAATVGTYTAAPSGSAPVITTDYALSAGVTFDYIQLPPATVGKVITVFNSSTSNGLGVIPSGSDTVNGNSGGVVPVATNSPIESYGVGKFVCFAAGEWSLFAQ